MGCTSYDETGYTQEDECIAGKDRKRDSIRTHQIFDTSHAGVYNIHHVKGGFLMPAFKRTQMYFNEDVLRELKKKAKEEKTTVAELVRESVSILFEKEREKDWIDDPLWNMIGSSSSKDRDLSVNHDKYLYGKKL